MNYTPPNKILITTDSNVIAYTKTIKNKNDLMYRYKFIKSLTKIGMEVDFSEGELRKNLNNFFKIIE